MSQACYLSPVFGAGAQLFTNQGVVLAGGIISAFQAGTTTPQNMYTDSTGTTPIGTTLTLDSSGRPAQEIWLTAGQPYKFTVTTSTGVSVGYTYDNISGVNDPGSSSAVSAEWTASGLTPTFISSTSFSVTGNQTAKFPTGQRVKYVVSGGTGYGTVSSSTYGTVTTIVIQADSTVLDSGLSSVAYAFLNAAAPSVDAIGVKYDSAITPPSTPTSVASLLGRVNYVTSLTTTGGSGFAYTLTLAPAPAAYATNQPMLVKFSFTPSGGSPTMNVNSLGAQNLKQVNSAGTKVAATVVSGQIAEVVYDGTDLVVLAPVVGGALLRTTYFTSTGTWTVGSGTNSIDVEVVGGGGGGPTSTVGSGGGGAGGYSRKFITSPTSPQTVTIGAGGVGAANGGATSFGSYLSASGGTQGANTTGGTGGVGSGGDLNLGGGGGGLGGQWASNIYFGNGGNSFFGGGAIGDIITSGGSISGNSAPANTGGGASGGSISAGTGGSGLCIVREYS